MPIAAEVPLLARPNPTSRGSVAITRLAPYPKKRNAATSVSKSKQISGLLPIYWEKLPRCGNFHDF
jgi:hypothetical protein